MASAGTRELQAIIDDFKSTAGDQFVNGAPAQVEHLCGPFYGEQHR
jgi:hypothetical protein